jgi:hypothetical protein
VKKNKKVKQMAKLREVLAALTPLAAAQLHSMRAKNDPLALTMTNAIADARKILKEVKP